MARYAPSLSLIVLCLIAFAFWKLGVWPFTDPVFTYDGYHLHVLGGIGYTAFAMLTMRACFPGVRFAPRVYALQGLGAFAVLSALELLQFDDPSRHVQIEDAVAQTLGILITLLVLFFFERRRP